MPTPTSGSSSNKKNQKNPDKPKVKPLYYNYNIENVLRLKKLLNEAVSFEFLGRAVVGSDFDRLVDLVCEVLPGEYDRAVVTSSLVDLAGKPITAEAIALATWRMAGNFKRLQQHHSVPAWHMQIIPEWVPAQVISCQLQKNSRGNVGAMFGFRILTGTSCGLSAFRWWSSRMIRYLSGEFGYSRARGKEIPPFPYHVPEQLVGLRLMLLIHPDKCDKSPGFDQLAFKQALLSWNKEIIRCRARVMPGFVCKAKRTISQPCHACPVGYLSCRAGTHRSDWIQRDCPACGKLSWFDPDKLSSNCVACTTNAIYVRTHHG